MEDDEVEVFLDRVLHADLLVAPVPPVRGVAQDGCRKSLFGGVGGAPAAGESAVVRAIVQHKHLGVEPSVSSLGTLLRTASMVVSAL